MKIFAYCKVCSFFKREPVIFSAITNLICWKLQYILVWIYLITGKCDLICTFCSNNLFSFRFCLLVSLPIYYLCAFFLVCVLCMCMCVCMSRWGMWLWMVILESGRDGKLVVIAMAAVLVHASVGLEPVTARALSVEGNRAKESVLRWQTAPGIQCHVYKCTYKSTNRKLHFKHNR